MLPPFSHLQKSEKRHYNRAVRAQTALEHGLQVGAGNCAGTWTHGHELSNPAVPVGTSSSFNCGGFRESVLWQGIGLPRSR